MGRQSRAGLAAVILCFPECLYCLDVFHQGLFITIQELYNNKNNNVKIEL